MKPIKFYIMLILGVVMTASAQFLFVSCDDDPGSDSYYTSTAEYAADFLKNRDKFSEFTAIVERASFQAMDLLGTWGSYTVFAPTNDAVEAYLHSKGLTAVDQLTNADCDTITRNHIIEQEFFTTDFNDGTYPVMNMLDRPLTVTCDSDTLSTPGQVQLAIYINKTSRMIQMDDSVKNGVVHTMNAVIGTSNDMVADMLSKDERVSIFYSALQLTHMDDSLQRFIDESYSVGSDSIDWTNDRLCIHTAVEYDNVAYMEHRYFKYTAFVETNDVYEKYGVTDLEGLKRLAAQIYDPKYPEDADVTDPTDRRNSLNRFVSYHLLPFQGTYYNLTHVDGPNSTLAASNFNRRYWDIADWYETMMPYSILKCSFPSGTQQGLYINRRGVQSRADERGVFVRGAKVTPFSDMGRSKNTCLNGIYHFIDDIIAYDQNTQQVVLDERLRIDASTLSPDFMTSEARGHYTRSNYENGKYGTWNTTSNHTNPQTCLGFKAGSAKNFEYSNNTHLHVRPRTLSFWSYQGDEVTILGIFDFKVKIPPVPAGTYEVRLFTCVDFTNRGIIQVYIDDIPQGIPFDMRPSGVTLFGWKSDTALGDEDAIASFDKSIHNLGWMKGPKSYFSATSESGGTQGTCFRDAANTIRKVLGHFTTDGKSDHYLRFQQKIESTKNAMNFDFLEVCPSSVYNNEYYAEDRW